MDQIRVIAAEMKAAEHVSTPAAGVRREPRETHLPRVRDRHPAARGDARDRGGRRRSQLRTASSGIRTRDGRASPRRELDVVGDTGADAQRADQPQHPRQLRRLHSGARAGRAARVDESRRRTAHGGRRRPCVQSAAVGGRSGARAPAWRRRRWPTRFARAKGGFKGFLRRRAARRNGGTFSSRRFGTKPAGSRNCCRSARDISEQKRAEEERNAAPRARARGARRGRARDADEGRVSRHAVPRAQDAAQLHRRLGGRVEAGSEPRDAAQGDRRHRSQLTPAGADDRRPAGREPHRVRQASAGGAARRSRRRDR